MTSLPPAHAPFSLCVYCASRAGTDPSYSATAVQVGRWIGEQGGELVYGGGHAGLMGTLADAVLAAGGRVTGVIPRALVDRERAHRGCTELLVVETMHERKRIMTERASAFLALPGGIGTMEEFFEVWSWRQLGYHDKPVGLLNQHGCYDALVNYFNASIASGVMSAEQMGLIDIDTDWNSLLPRLLAAHESSR